MGGKIITITGSDGSGKATQTRLLMERAEREGYSVMTLSFPQYGKFWGKAVKAYLQGHFGSLDEIDPKDASMLFALDRLSAKDKILHWLEQGHNILFDRYIESNFGHQAGKYKGKEREEMLEWLYNLEVKQFGLPESDIVIYLDLPVEFSKKALLNRNKDNKEEDKKDLHEDDMKHLIAAQEAYRHLVEKNENWTRISCLKNENERYSREDVFKMVWDIARQHLTR